MAQVIYSPRADADLYNIATTIAQDKPDAAVRWVHKIRETCDLLASHPQMGETRSGYGVPGCRSFSVGSYVIFFRPIEDGIQVARIVHGSRDLRRLS
jgi:toxin ParE1/3/4